ncbi:NAD(P)-binding domain-containing protein [Gryllotalpicola ginsengisoli]|uniref:NAD(P)-binding domain-containing protein n=1 Tax=Gryllotalpicola ginsengisoli TaxID=444608 RepID=UPI0003B4BF44|nr:NAD(P)-binding domain-containing protein [Gryllotalpicola ginsengisoli]
MPQQLPVIVIGAGPQGLAAAAHLLEHGIEPLVLERGSAAGAAVAEWGHVRLFSEWPELIDRAARRLLEATGWAAPGAGYPTGGEWVARYLAPLAEALGDRVRTGVTVTGISRAGRDKVVNAGRAAQPFEVRGVAADGTELRLLGRAVLDASGTWNHPNPAGASGLPALGEKQAAQAGLISYRIPPSVAQLAGKHVVVVGSGHSAAHAVIRLAGLVRRAPGTRVEWAIRGGAPSGLSSADDQLPARGALGGRAQEAVADGRVVQVTGFRTTEIRRTGGRLSLVGDDGRRLDDVDHVIALTGFRPDLSIVRELRTAIDPGLEAVAGLAGEIDPNVHSCGTVRATGALELAQPEPGFYLLGAKSYGRAPTFLALTGYEQVRSVVAELAGDHEAAARNELVLPESGVCSGAAEVGGASCCAPAQKQPIRLGVKPAPVEA